MTRISSHKSLSSLQSQIPLYQKINIVIEMNLNIIKLMNLEKESQREIIKKNNERDKSIYANKQKTRNKCFFLLCTERERRKS